MKNLKKQIVQKKNTIYIKNFVILFFGIFDFSKNKRQQLFLSLWKKFPLHVKKDFKSNNFSFFLENLSRKLFSKKKLYYKYNSEKIKINCYKTKFLLNNHKNLPFIPLHGQILVISFPQFSSLKYLHTDFYNSIFYGGFYKGFFRLVPLNEFINLAKNPTDIYKIFCKIFYVLFYKNLNTTRRVYYKSILVLKKQNKKFI